VLADPVTYARAVPHEEFARRRHEDPVAWVEEPTLWAHSTTEGSRERRGSGFWALTRHACIVAAARNPATFSSAAQGAFLADPRTLADLERARQLLVNMDAPEHSRIRRHVTAAFTAREVAALGEQIRAVADEVVTSVMARGRFDAVGELAAEVPLLVLADLLGVPRTDRGLLLEWSNNLVGFDDPQFGGGSVDAYRRTFQQAFEYARAMAADRRRRARSDLVSRLVHSVIDGHRLSDAEFCQLWLLLVIAGNETTRHLLAGGLLALIEWPDQRARLVDDPTLTARAVDELLRWVTPIMQFRRTATVDTELAGQRIRAGDKVVFYYISANRDDRVFTRADQLDLGRRPNPHLAFGVGPHYCLGSQLAHLEAQAVLDVLRPHLPRLSLAGPVVRLASTFMNGIKSLPVQVADEPVLAHVVDRAAER
jgi:cytochrome P450